MIFEPILIGGTQVPGAALVIAEPVADHRGYFTRLWSDNEASDLGVALEFTQLNLAFNHKRGTLRGMHFQTPPAAEAKLVRVVAGVVWDVLVDLRSESPTYLRTWGTELDAESHHAVLLPVGCAHGYQTLADRTAVVYQTTHRYVPEAAIGVRHDDPAFGIEWPLEVSEISAADATWGKWQGQDARQFSGAVP